MANPYIQKEVTKIINEQNIKYPQNLALAAAWIIANFKGVNIKIYDVTESSSLCDFNIVASMQNTTQAKAITDELTFNIKQNNGSILSLEGLSDAEWILVDAGDVIIHLFQETSRDIFDLDSLWKDYPQVQIPSEYYFGSAEVEVPRMEDPTDNFF
jgi:ribosome-associated protein